MDSGQTPVEDTQRQRPTPGNNNRPDRSGQQLGSYRLLRLLADGGFAEVYLGEHIHLGTNAAIKVLHAQLVSEDLQQFREEARIVARLRHPHIVSILDFNVQDNTPFLVMDYAPNGTLRQRHPKRSTVTPSTILSYVRQIADALHYAHSEHVVHCDIKPENMLIGLRNEILLSDFGIAIIERSTQHQITRDIIGTLAYMAPEQLQGQPRLASDQYALGIIVYEWLCGDTPFRGSIAELSAQHIHAQPPSLCERNPNITPVLEAVVFKALSKDPTARYDSVLDFAQAFEAALPHDRQPAMYLNETSFNTQLPVAPSAFHLSATVRATPPETVQKNYPSRTIKGRISRRNVVFGLVGLTTLGLASGGLAWITQLSLHGQAPKKAIKPKPSPTPTPIPIGTPFLTYFGHSDGVNAAAWSPSNNTYIASGSNDHSVHVWFASSGTDARTAYGGHTDSVNAVAWSPDGQTIASASTDKTIQVWKVFPNNGDTPFSYSGHTDSVNAVAWSPDGQTIASASNDHTVKLWNATDGSNPITYSGHTDAVLTIAWSPDGTTLASGGADKTVRLWKAGDGSDISSYGGHIDTVRAVSWSPDGKYIASASADTTIQVWEAATGTLLFTYKNHTASVNAVAWSPDGTRLASASTDKTVQVWNYADGSNSYTYSGHSDTVNAAIWSLDGTVIASASADKTIQEWQAI